MRVWLNYLQFDFLKYVSFSMDYVRRIFLLLFATPVGALGDSLAQRRADDLGVSFGTIRTWGSIGFATSSLAIGLVLTLTGVEYMIWPYLAFAFIALFVTFRVKDVEVSKEPVSFADFKRLLQNKPFVIFLFFMMFLTISHRANDSFIGLYINQLGGTNFVIGSAWFIGVISEAIVFATAGYWFKNITR